MSRELKIQEFDDKHLCHPHAPQIQKVKRLASNCLVAMQIDQTRIGINHAIRRIGIESELLEDC